MGTCSDGDVRLGPVTGLVYHCVSGEWWPSTVSFNYNSITEYKDITDGGTSSITWNQQDYDIEKALIYGKEFSVTLGPGYDYPYVAIQVNLDSAQDISDWDGICLRYKSTIGFGIELFTEDEAIVTEYNNYKATVPKTVQRLSSDFPWAKFKQGSGWGKTVDQATVLAKVAGIRLKFEGTAGTSGTFVIEKIGHQGECRY